MNINDKSLQARILEKLNNSGINPNDLKSVVLAIGNKEGKFLIDLYPQFNGEIRFDKPAYKMKEINKKDLESMENDSSIAVFHIENGNDLRLSSELVSDSEIKDIPISIGEKGEGKSIKFIIEDELGERYNGVIIELPTGCKVKIENGPSFHTSSDINRTYAFLEREAHSAETFEEFKSRF